MARAGLKTGRKMGEKPWRTRQKHNASSEVCAVEAWKRTLASVGLH